jgi:DNA gyrase/topoisomerase IV subunit A
MTKPQSSQYIDEQRRNYSLYILQMRAIPAATDGLKAAGRRTLWVARDGKKYKTATLAGATMPLHPHASPDDAINTLAAPYDNNIPLYHGDGAFGTLLEPKAYGASRYTSVKVSKFTQDVVFKDIEIIPMTENYDGTLEEPVHFLPLIPLALLNPTEGIAVGFKSDIMPRALEDLIITQISHLKGAKIIADPMPKFIPLQCAAFKREEGDKSVFFYFEGDYEDIDGVTVRITKLPYGLNHEVFTNTLDNLIEKGVIIDYTDKSKDKINVVVKFKKGNLRGHAKQDVMKTLGLIVRHGEILNVLDFDGKRIWSPAPIELIRKFTDWRLGWYVKRYERLRDLLNVELQRSYDIRLAIKHKIGAVAQKTASRAELKELLKQLKIVNLDYIADLPVYRFTEDERVKNEERIKQGEKQLKEYEKMLSSEGERRKVYITELQQILTNNTKGQYNE